MADAQLDIVLSAKDMSQQAFNSLNKNIEGVGGGLEMFANKLVGLAAGFGVFKTLSQALESAKLGSTLEKQATAFSNLSDAAGTSSKRMLDILKSASQGMIAEADLMGAAGKAMLMSIPADKIGELMKIAAATSKMTGQGMTEAFNDITLGVARQSRMILDNLGIIVNVDKANQDYARTLGKTAEALTDTEKRQAFMNEVLESGNDMITRLGSSSAALNGVNELVVAQTNLWNEVNKSVASFLDKELSGYAKMINWIDEKLKGMRTSAGEATKSEAWKEIEMLRSLESKGRAQPGTTSRKEAEFNSRYLTPQMGLKPSEELKRYGSFSTPAWGSAGWREKEGNFAANTEEQNKQIMKDRDEWFKKLADEAKKAEEEVKKLHDEVKKLEDEFADSKIFGGESSNYEKMQDQLRSGFQLSGMEDRRAESLYGKGTDWAESEKMWAAYLNRVQEATRANEIFNDTMDITAQSSANAFAEFVTGTKSAKDAFQGLVQSMIAGMARLASQKFIEQIFGAIGKEAGGFFGTGSSGWQPAFNSSVGPMVAKGAAFGPAGMIEFARGGIVTGPTVFPFARGTGLMGEAGPEAIMPLSRNSRGELGVVGGAGGGDTYHIYNITAMDSQSVEQALRRSGAVPALAAESYANNGIMRSVLRATP